MNEYWRTQVWKGEKWIGFFANDTDAAAWVSKQADPAAYTINNIGPRESAKSMDPVLAEAGVGDLLDYLMKEGSA